MVTHTICKPHGHRAGQQVQSIFMNEFLRMLDIDQLALGSIHLLLLPQPIRPVAQGAKRGGAGCLIYRNV